MGGSQKRSHDGNPKMGLGNPEIDKLRQRIKESINLIAEEKKQIEMLKTRRRIHEQQINYYETQISDWNAKLASLCGA